MGFHPNKLTISENSLFSLTPLSLQIQTSHFNEYFSEAIPLPNCSSPASLYPLAQLGHLNNNALITGSPGQSSLSSEPSPTVLIYRYCNINTKYMFRSPHLVHFLQSLDCSNGLPSLSQSSHPYFPGLLTMYFMLIISTPCSSKVSIYLCLCFCFLHLNVCASKPTSTCLCNTSTKVQFKCHIWK